MVTFSACPHRPLSQDKNYQRYTAPGPHLTARVQLQNYKDRHYDLYSPRIIEHDCRLSGHARQSVLAEQPPIPQLGRPIRAIFRGVQIECRGR